MADLNRTHDPNRKSWVTSANAPEADFPIQNLPFGVFTVGTNTARIGVAIGDQILDLTALEASGRLTPAQYPVFAHGALNPFMAQAPEVWSKTRGQIADLLDASSGDPTVPLVSQSIAQMHMPFFVRGFTDFYASREHATNVGTMFRGADRALMPNWLHIPIGYNGRASTVVISDTPIRRPNGQLKGPEDPSPRFGPCARLDIEVELGAIVGTPNAMGHPIGTAEAFNALFGYVVLNDWSARDIQVWEYQPLGPFQAKAFATTVSPWIVTREALEPFRVSAPEREVPLLPYLQEDSPNNLDVTLDVTLAPSGGRPRQISRTNARWLYYSAAQQMAHHASSGCAMETGDLLGSGTISGATPDSLGSLLEMTWNGRDPVQIDGGHRTFLEDGDTVSITGWCSGPYRIGFGPCRGQIFPAPPLPG